jgi:hypothetical protein
MWLSKFGYHFDGLIFKIKIKKVDLGFSCYSNWNSTPNKQINNFFYLDLVIEFQSPFQQSNCFPKLIFGIEIWLAH